MNTDIETALKNFAKAITKGKIIFDAIITAVNDNNTVDIKVKFSTVTNPEDFLTKSNVILETLVGKQSSIYGKPKIGTACLVCFRDGDINRPQIFKIHEYDEFYITCGKSKLKVSNDGWVFNDGKLDGLIKINDLITKINRLEDKLKSHEHAYIPYPGGIAGLPVFTTPATAVLPPLLPDNTLIFNNTIKNDLENTKIKQ